MTALHHESQVGARVAGELTDSAASAHVREMFDGIASSYDRLNHLLSFGLDRLWWRRAADAFLPTLARPESRILDICCGTGDMTAALLARRPASSAHTPTHPVIGLDFSAAMLDRARAKYTSPEVQWVQGDAMHLPYPDASFDLVTAAFGFRNLSNYAGGLHELHRVLPIGGQLGILECNQPDGVTGAFYNLYFRHILPFVGGRISHNRPAYEYLPASVARFPRPPRMFELLTEAGFTDLKWDGYLLGSAGLYRATKAS